MNASISHQSGQSGLRLSSLLAAVQPSSLAAGIRSDPMVSGLSADSQRVRPGWVFAACQGNRQHGLRYLEPALQGGAGAVLWESDTDFDATTAAAQCEAVGRPLVAVPALGRQLGPLASRLHGDPSARLAVIGVTGTDGKTSVSQFLAQALAADGQACGLIGTLGYGLHGSLETASHTTPDAASIQQLLADFSHGGADFASMEVSSHALDQHRVAGVRFHAAVLTNLGRDHLDYHLTRQAYAAAKARLFQTPGLGWAVLNLDDDFGRSLVQNPAAGVRVLAYSMLAESRAEVRVQRLDMTAGGLSLHAVTPVGPVQAEVPLMGRFNAQNLLAVIAVLISLDWHAPRISRALACLRAVPGRMERFGGGKQPLVVVDYAHTPGALEAALQALAEHVTGRIWCVFGCGGERDSGKRGLMAAVAEAHAHHIILTDDNPRGEDPEAVLADIQAGFRNGPARVERDRARAIEIALARAGSGDAVLVAGKGHEDYQITAQGVRHYSDRQTVAALLGGVPS